MKKSIYAVASVFLLTLSVSAQAAQEANTKATCASLKANIKKYSDLQKVGGTEAQMRTWRLKQQDLQGIYGDSNCITSAKK